MVFANTVDAVEAVAKVLTGAGIECFCYHSNSSLEERTKNLISFQQKGGVFVCTDAAARGLDVPNVSHVIQVCSINNLLCISAITQSAARMRDIGKSNYVIFYFITGRICYICCRFFA